MLTSIGLVNWLAHRHADFAIAPLTVIAGPNGSGKTSVGDAIAFGLTGELRRVGMKGERSKLLSDGAEQGKVILRGPDGTLIRDIVTGKLTQPAPILPDRLPPGLLAVLLSPVAFAHMAEDDRRKLLFGLMGVNLAPAKMRELLIQRGHSAAKDLPTHGTLETWHETAKSWASEARGRWKGVTGEAYGEKKAESWQAPRPEALEEKDADELRNQITLLEGGIAKANQELGAIRSKAKAPGAPSVDLEALKRRAGQLDAWLSADREAHAEMVAASAAVRAARAALDALPGAGEPPQQLHCPDCGAVLMLDPDGRGTHLVAYAADDPVAARQARQRAEANLRAAQEKLQEAQAAEELAHRRFLEAQDAARAIQAHDLASENGGDAPAPDGSEAEVQARMADHQRALATTRADLEAIGKHAEAVKAADRKTQKAGEAHAEAKAWVAIAAALAPDGIQAEELAKAMKPLGDTLTELAARSGWPVVTIGGDMGISAGGRPYGLLSESEQWRADALIALALARTAQVGLVVLDRFDVLDLPSRGRAMRFLFDLTRAGEWAVIVSGVFKAPPQLPPAIKVHWLGEPVAQEKAA